MMCKLLFLFFFRQQSGGSGVVPNPADQSTEPTPTINTYARPSDAGLSIQKTDYPTDARYATDLYGSMMQSRPIAGKSQHCTQLSIKQLHFITFKHVIVIIKLFN